MKKNCVSKKLEKICRHVACGERGYTMTGLCRTHSTPSIKEVLYPPSGAIARKTIFRAKGIA
jgi:hypothetical protein